MASSSSNVVGVHYRVGKKIGEVRRRSPGPHRHHGKAIGLTLTGFFRRHLRGHQPAQQPASRYQIRESPTRRLLGGGTPRPPFRPWR